MKDITGRCYTTPHKQNNNGSSVCSRICVKTRRFDATTLTKTLIRERPTIDVRLNWYKGPLGTRAQPKWELEDQSLVHALARREKEYECTQADAHRPQTDIENINVHD